ncbi:hypothetical protein EXIGLDRAFT_766951 [Exidia glandulosa HHB12029]|uniref:Uncharacterized protein n=1 Tax=Exidia glandulosa HHB12029 TaxID=1314781 RepID=A0A165JCV2_EXIGL|nr:hypothetical protein EXIGLDRAFT_766951 [Exidia glandulosa HHB12029]
MSHYSVARIDSPTGWVCLSVCALPASADVTPSSLDEQIEVMATLAASLMFSDPALLSLTGGRADLLPQLLRLNLRAARVGGGDFFLAHQQDGTFAGYAMCMGPGKKLYSTEEQRNEDYHSTWRH